MKAETKAKRRVTLSIAGLGLLDETEAQDVAAQASQPAIDKGTGEVIEERPQEERHSPPITERQRAFIEHNFAAVGLTQEALWTLINGIAPQAKRIDQLSAAQASGVIAKLKAMYEKQKAAKADTQTAEAEA